MSVNLNEAITRIKQAGAKQVRAVPMPGQSVVDGSYQIETFNGTTWDVLVEGITQATANSIIAQATNRVLLG